MELNMLGLIPIIDLAAIFIALRAIYPDHDWRESVLAAGILWGVAVALSTEVLGVFHAIGWQTLSLTWLAVFIVSVSIILRNRKRLSIKLRLPQVKGALAWAMFGIVAVYVSITFVVAILAPPNTNDSMQYHMSRVMHWIVNRSVDFYATPSDRQLWMPPLGEYAILHFQILAGSDILANIVQWIAMAGSVIGVSLLASYLGARQKGQLFAALFAATLPMGVLQASGTQTDYVAAFWAVCFAYFAVSESLRFFSVAESKLTLNSVLLAFSFGLGVFSKGTFVACAAPFLLWVAVTLIWKKNWKTMAGLAVLGLAALLLINANLWRNNYHTFGNPLGPAVGHLGSTVFTPAAVFSTGLRNAAMQMAFDIGPANKALYLTTMGVHNLLGIDINDPGTTLGTYRIRYSTNEDFAGNNWHFVLLSVALIYLGVVFIKWIYRKRIRKEKPAVLTEQIEQPLTLILLFAGTILLSYAVFSALFKWQDTDSRLLLPWFLTAAPMAGWVFDRVHRYLQAGVVILLAVSSLTVLLSNPSRPLIASGQNESILTAPRIKTRFNNSPEIMNDYISVVVTARDLGCHSIGLGLDSSTPEYLIWAVLSQSGKGLSSVENLVALRETEQYAPTQFKPCAVICNICSTAREMGYDKKLDRGSLQLYVQPAQGQ
jgi:hypothetical protein